MPCLTDPKKRMIQRRLALLDRYVTFFGCPCGEKDARCLDLHHVDPSTKVNGVRKLAKRGSMRAMKAEVRKCIILCANCHRKLHGRVVER